MKYLNAITQNVVDLKQGSALRSSSSDDRPEVKSGGTVSPYYTRSSTRLHDANCSN